MADSSSISNLKSEIRVLERLFGKDHLQFRFFSHSIDEVHCKFINGDQIIEIIGNLTDFYPQSPPIWFSDAVNCDNVIKELSNLSDNRLAYQVNTNSIHFKTDHIPIYFISGENIVNKTMRNI